MAKAAQKIEEAAPAREPEVMETGAETERAAVTNMVTGRELAQVGLSRVPALARLSEQEFNELVAGMKLQIERIGIIHRTVMVEGVHYGTIPGTKKPTLYQPGADLLNRMHTGVATYPREALVRTILPQPEGIAPLIVWDAMCEVRDRADGSVIGIGAGSCNSHESKYRYRQGARRCPACGKTDPFMRSKKEPEWFCWSKRGGCGASFPLNAPSVVDQVVGKIENMDVMDLDNTLKKMAMKRAKVAAANELSLASATFTQDLEDMDDNARAAAAGRDESTNGDEPPPIGDLRKPAAGQTVDQVLAGGAKVTGGTVAGAGNGASQGQRKPAATPPARPAQSPAQGQQGWNL